MLFSPKIPKFRGKIGKKKRVFSNLIVQIFTTAANDLLQAGWWANVAALDAKSGAKIVQIERNTKFI